jgi:hypothetical protein
MKYYLDFGLGFCKVLFTISPFRIIRWIRLGAKEAALFRAIHQRDPDDQEWREIVRQAMQY